MSGRRAGSGVGKYNAKGSKQDSKRFNSITKTSHFDHLDILFIYASFQGYDDTVIRYRANTNREGSKST